MTIPSSFVKFCYMDASLLPALHDALIVAQTSSVGEAARRLHKTPSAVSQQLRRIEEHYGVKLFEKDGRRVRPSPAGEAASAKTRVMAPSAASPAGLGRTRRPSFSNSFTP